MKRLIIVGNGFDLHHTMKTQYTHYRDYLISIGKNDVVKCFEGNGEFEPEYLWSRLEEVVGSLNYEDAYCYLTSYSSDDWKDSAHHDFQYEVEKMTHYWPELKDNLAGWIRQIEYTKADDSLRELLRGANSFLSFNYTNTLEVLYGISKSNITYIHGDASVTDDLVLGHRGDSWYPEWDPNNPDGDVRLLEASSIMDDHFDDTRKQIESIIQQHKTFFERCSEYDEIYVIGLSYNETDRMYIEEIVKHNENAKWFFNWYSKEDFNYIDKYARSLSIAPNCYKKISIDQLHIITNS